MRQIYGKTTSFMLLLSMLPTRIICVVIFVFTCVMVSAQENEIKPTSATDSKVRIHNKKTASATAPPKRFKARYNEKSKGAANVKDSSPKVQKHNKRKQKRNAKFRSKGRDL